MANAKQTNRKSSTASKSTGRRRGRPSNAERAQNMQSQQAFLIDTAVAAASAAVKSALGIEGGVSTIGTPQTGQSQSAGNSTASTSQSSTRSASRKAPGRRIDPKSKMSLTREFFDKNKNTMERADLVKAAADKFGYSAQTGNTYISKIAKEAGFTFKSGRGRGGRGRSSGNGQSQRTGTNG